MEFLFEMFVIVLAACAISFGIALGVNAAHHHFAPSYCAAISRELGRETKYVEYNYWARDCITPQSNGKWISVNKLRGE